MYAKFRTTKQAKWYFMQANNASLNRITKGYYGAPERKANYKHL